MFMRGNIKLGLGIGVWSLPAIETCPGRTIVCESICYADRGRFLGPSVRRRLKRNWKEARKKNFVSRAIAELRRARYRIFRIHAAGDFENAAYVRKWIRIVKALPWIRFYAYTRSWRVDRMLKSLQELAALPNMQLWYSADACSGRPPRHTGVRSCYLARHDADMPPYRVDLVFRDRHDSVMKFTPDGSLVCPYENGVTQITCRKCSVCWNDREVKEKPRGAGIPRGVVLHSITPLSVG